MELRPGVAVVSDIAAHHAETLYGSGTRTVAALCDLAEICQAAVLNDSLVVSPTAYHGSTLLRSLDFVPDLTPTVTDASDEDDDDGDAVLIDVKDGRLASDQPFGELILAFLYGEMLEASGMFAGLTNAGRLGSADDRGLFFLDRLPIFLFLLQAKKGAAAFDSEESRHYLLETTEPDRTAYRDYATRLLRLEEECGVQPTFSCLEEPLGDDARIARAIDTIQTPTFWGEFEAKLKEAASGDRRGFFERWRVPALGMAVLGRAETLDDLPKAIDELRDRLQTVRGRLVGLEPDKQAALTADGGLDDRRYREAVAIDQQIRTAFEAFDDALADHRRATELKRSELVFNLPKYVSWLASLGIGSVQHLLEIADLKRRHYLGYVPGLNKALQFVKASDDAYVVETAERLLGRSAGSFALHVSVLRLAADRTEAYTAYADDAAPVDDDAMIIGGDARLPFSEIWWRLVKDPELRRMMLHPLPDQPSATA